MHESIRNNSSFTVSKPLMTPTGERLSMRLPRRKSAFQLQHFDIRSMKHSLQGQKQRNPAGSGILKKGKNKPLVQHHKDIPTHHLTKNQHWQFSSQNPNSLRPRRSRKSSHSYERSRFKRKSCLREPTSTTSFNHTFLKTIKKMMVIH